MVGEPTRSGRRAGDVSVAARRYRCRRGRVGVDGGVAEVVYSPLFSAVCFRTHGQRPRMGVALASGGVRLRRPNEHCCRAPSSAVQGVRRAAVARSAAEKARGTAPPEVHHLMPPSHAPPIVAVRWWRRRATYPQAVKPIAGRDDEPGRPDARRPLNERTDQRPARPAGEQRHAARLAGATCRSRGARAASSRWRRACAARATDDIDAQGLLVSPPSYRCALPRLDATLSYGLPRVDQMRHAAGRHRAVGRAQAPEPGRLDPSALRCATGRWPACCRSAAHRHDITTAPAGGQALLEVRRQVTTSDLQLVGLSAGRRAVARARWRSFKRTLDMGVDVVGGIPASGSGMADGAEACACYYWQSPSAAWQVDMH